MDLHDKLKFLFELKDKIVMEGEKVTLKAIVAILSVISKIVGTLEVKWYKISSGSGGGGQTQIQSDGRFSLSASASTEFELQISSVKIEDAGSYMIEVTSTKLHITISSKCTITVMATTSSSSSTTTTTTTPSTPTTPTTPTTTPTTVCFYK